MFWCKTRVLFCYRDIFIVFFTQPTSIQGKNNWLRNYPPKTFSIRAHASTPTHITLTEVKCVEKLIYLSHVIVQISVCKYTVHERCVQRCMASCITTYSKKKTKGTPTFQHHWTEGNCYGRCSKCRKRIKAYHGITGLTCRWCRMTVCVFLFLSLLFFFFLLENDIYIHKHTKI